MFVFSSCLVMLNLNFNQMIYLCVGLSDSIGLCVEVLGLGVVYSIS
jgi:hypothetical protein